MHGQEEQGKDSGADGWTGRWKVGQPNLNATISKPSDREDRHLLITRALISALSLTPLSSTFNPEPDLQGSFRFCNIA